MNSKLLRFTLAIASALIMVPRTAHAVSYTFDVDASSGIGIGYFSISLPDNWPGNIGQSTLFPATAFSGLFAVGDPWTALSIALNEPLAPHPDNAMLSGASTRLPSFSAITAGVGITPVEAVDNIRGVSLRGVVVPEGGFTGVFLAASVLGLVFFRRRM